eukprot:4594440-Pyramimonas_sp.AAC.1
MTSLELRGPCRNFLEGERGPVVSASFLDVARPRSDARPPSGFQVRPSEARLPGRTMGRLSPPGRRSPGGGSQEGGRA